MEPRYVGVIVIQPTKIWADGQAVDVAAWQFKDTQVIASGADGQQIMTFQVTEQDVLIQTAEDGSQLILRKLNL